MTPDDHPVTVTLDAGDATQQLRAEAVDDGGPRGFFAVRGPEVWDYSESRHGFSTNGDDVLLVSKERVVGIEGPADALDKLLSPPRIGTPGGTSPGIQTRDADAPADCPECGGTVANSLGGDAECIDCGWTEGGGGE